MIFTCYKFSYERDKDADKAIFAITSNASLDGTKIKCCTGIYENEIEFLARIIGHF